MFIVQVLGPSWRRCGHSLLGPSWRRCRHSLLMWSSW